MQQHLATDRFSFSDSATEHVAEVIESLKLTTGWGEGLHSLDEIDAAGIRGLLGEPSLLNVQEGEFRVKHAGKRKVPPPESGTGKEGRIGTCLPVIVVPCTRQWQWFLRGSVRAPLT